MDQVRAIIRTIWQQRFWVLISIAAVVSVFCWMSAAGDLDAQFSKRQSEINNMFSAMRNLNSQALHPNEDVIRGNTQQTVQQGNITLALWEDLYGRQHEEVLFWPKDHLDAGFIEEIEKLKFGDKFPPQKSQAMRSNYWNYIGKRFDGLLEIVQALKNEERSGSSYGGEYGGGYGGEYGGGYGGEYGGGAARGLAPGEDAEQDYLVQWLDQGNLQAQLLFKDNMPTALEIWVTQENLWVYETLLNVIANTNKARGATRPDNTAVRAIVALQVGQEAAAGGMKHGHILPPETSGGASAGYGRGGESGG
ncbi:MAG: hypothetical protein MI725_08335, partial [Pirellulales bacterium]|nr:hypothetical protein [Pirellulales bacterium]